MKKLLIQAWGLERDSKGYHISATHYGYLTEIIKYYSRVCLLAPVKNLPDGEKSKLTYIDLPTVEVYELPYSSTYLSAIKHFKLYRRAYRELSSRFDRVYVRYPSPFGWISRYHFKDIIVHFVGDPVDATLANPNFSKLKRKVLVNLFKPEHNMFIKTCKQARVYTNGYHLKQRLEKYEINAIPVISSTLNSNAFYFDAGEGVSPQNIKLLYTGFLRRAKGIETLIRAFAILVKQYPAATFTIVGAGEFEAELKTLVTELKLNDGIIFTGHVHDRAVLNQLYRSHNLFCFASLSEGSPRVILEAMANGINVVSTPVGALPNIFRHEKDIVFAETGDPNDFAAKITALVNDSDKANLIKKAAFDKAKNYTTATFIQTIFG